MAAAADDDDDVSAADCCGGGVPGVLVAAAEAEEERLRPRVGDETGEGSEGDERDPPAVWNEPGRSGSGVESRLMREATLTRCRCWSVGDAAPGGAGGAPRCAGGGGRAMSFEGGGRSHVAPFDVFRSMKLMRCFAFYVRFLVVVDELLMKKNDEEEGGKKR